MSDSRGTVANSLKKQIAAQLRDDVTQRTMTQYIRKLEREELEAQATKEPVTQVIPPVRSVADYASISNGNGKAVKAPKVRGGGR